ncbi:MAG: HDIG domain-containing protein [Deltaproteobacteria bacterium]|jgi:putative nucleotidyltransferase with HDIG domain|nr:HDIG domain-containing protein [Deltaproteobacteria bacterium]
MTSLKFQSPARGTNGRKRKRGLKALAQKAIAYVRRPAFAAKAVFVAVVATITVYLANPIPQLHHAGQLAPHTIRADRYLVIPDKEATEALKTQAYESVVPLFVLDDKVTQTALDNVRTLFRRGRSIYASFDPKEMYPGQEAFPLSFREDWASTFNEDGNAEALLERARAAHFSERLERSVTWLTVELLSQGLRADDPAYSLFYGKTVNVSRSGAGPSPVSFDAILTLSRARNLVAPKAILLATDYAEDSGDLTIDLTMALLRPNLILDSSALEEDRLRAIASVEPVEHRLSAGQIIVREGEIISPLDELLLKALSGESDPFAWTKRTIGLLIILMVFLAVTQSIANLEKTQGGPKESILMTVLLLMYVLMTWASIRLGEGMAKGFDFIEVHTIFLAMPIPAAAMLAVIFLGNRRAIPLAFLGSILAATIAPLETFAAFIYLCNGTLISILHLRHISERGRFIPSALMCGLVNALTIIGLALMNGNLFLKPFTYDLVAAILSGLLSGILASGLVPLFELLMGFTTNLKLMELGNLNRPLLRELMLAAPGTYHHSVIVGSMVEAAAEAIGANPHLARVGAYYHDIGKIKKPLYFIENQSGENRHDSLTPTMSVLLLVGHVKDGVDIALANKLPRQVVDIVEQHHGTSLMSYFYHKAQENRGPHDPLEINESDFRYPGPKPASKEAGLVMLADICEAATRTLTEPTPMKIRELVRTLVNRSFDDGQLDSSCLVLKDLTVTMEVFTNILVGIYHHRVVYPALNKVAASSQAARSKAIYGHLNQEHTKRVTH